MPAPASLALLVRTPAVLRAHLLGLPAQWLDAPEAPDAWSPRQVVCHLADLERDAWLPRVRHILEHGRAHPLPGVARERFREVYAFAPLETVLDDFQAARAANLHALDALHLDDGALSTTGRHARLGDVRLSHLLSTWVVHDLTHLAQITRTLAAQHREAVGPFVEFLSILRTRDPHGTTAPPEGPSRGPETVP